MNKNMPTKEQVESLITMVLKETTIQLSIKNQEKLRIACIRTYIDNPDISEIKSLAAIVKVYLKFILDFPELKIELSEQL